MAWLPISSVVPQYVDSAGDPYSGAVLKAYAVNTSTNIPFALDSANTAQATSITLNSSGFPEVSGNVVIPHLDQDYKLALYPTQAAADADSGAIWAPDNIQLPGLSDASSTATGAINVAPLKSYGGAYFDGSNDYLTRGAGLTGASDGKKGSLVAFVTFDATASAIEYVIANTGLALALRRNADGTFTVLAENAAGTTILDISTESAYNTANTVYCIMTSWDLSTPGSQQLYVNGAGDLVTSTFTDDSIDYTVSDWAVGADTSGANKLAGNVLGLWLDTTNNLDFSETANQQKFRDASGNVVALGPRGELPTESQPILYLGDNAYGNFEQNRGSGGNLAVTGALEAATVSLNGQVLYGNQVRQVVTAVSTTDDSISTTSDSDTSLSGSITVRESDSKVIIQCFGRVQVSHDGAGTNLGARLATWTIRRSSGSAADIVNVRTGRTKNTSDTTGAPTLDGLAVSGQETPGIGTHTYVLRGSVNDTDVDAELLGSSGAMAMMIMWEVAP